MRLGPTLVIIGFLLAGCATPPAAEPGTAQNAQPNQPHIIVTPIPFL